MFKRFLSNEQGNVTIIVSLAMFMLIAAIGVAIDMSRADTAKSKIQTALDSAALAAARTINQVPAGETTQQWVDSQAQTFFNANFPSGYLETNPITLAPAVITVSGSNTTISLTANTAQKTTLMSAINVPSVTVGDNTQVTTGGEGIELVLAVDNSGSMAYPVNSANSSVSKIQALQSAATQLVNIIYGTGTNTPNNLFMGIVPFTQAVNVGTSHENWLSQYPNNFPSMAPWYGCVSARPQPYDINDNVPSTSLYGENSMFQAYYFPNSNTPPLTPQNQSTLNVWGSSNPYETNGTQVGPNEYCPQPLTMMTSNKTTLINNINNLTAQGDTLINIGMAWAQRMLSPKWNGIWGGSMNSTGSSAYPSLPLPYNTPGMQKVVIMMTDGWNHVLPFNYTAYGFLNQGNIGGAQDEATAENNLITYTKQVCDNLKSNNVIIYTIGFGQGDTGGDSSSDTIVDGSLLQYCATDSNHYFLAPTNAALTTAFSTIANQVSNLRVSQ
jgi:Flp pilus assembly protein TadG